MLWLSLRGPPKRLRFSATLLSYRATGHLVASGNLKYFTFIPSCAALCERLRRNAKGATQLSGRLGVGDSRSGRRGYCFSGIGGSLSFWAANFWTSSATSFTVPCHDLIPATRSGSKVAGRSMATRNLNWNKHQAGFSAGK